VAEVNDDACLELVADLAEEVLAPGYVASPSAPWWKTIHDATMPGPGCFRNEHLRRIGAGAEDPADLRTILMHDTLTG